MLDYPIVALPGPRQVGKTTLARLYVESLGNQPVHHFDLESPADLARLSNPELALSPLEGLVILDEIQRLPELFPVLRVLADRPGTPARFLILGNASLELVKGVSGVCHALLGLESMDALEAHPKLGASWEGFALEQILSVTGNTNAYFWATHSGAELDLLVFHQGKRLGFEFKYSENPSTTKSMQVALADLGLDHLHVVYPGKHRIPLTKSITASPLPNLLHTLSAP